MSLNRWKVLACTLTVGVGGLAVFATPPASNKTDAPKEPAPLPDLTVKPSSPANGTETPQPAKPGKVAEFELIVPDPVVAPASPTKAEEPAKKPATEPVFEPLTPPAPVVVPASGTEAKDAPKPADKKPEAGQLPAVVVPPPAKPDVPDLPKPATPAPDVPKIHESKPPAIDVSPPASPPLKIEDSAPRTPEATPAPTVVKPDLPPVGSRPVKDGPPPTADTVKMPLTPPSTPKASGSADAARLKMLLRMGDGQPRFEIRNSATTELLLKVYGEKVEMQAPPDAKSSLAGVTAMGRVRFTAPGIEGTCDHLSILSGTGEVLLKGNIHLKTKRGKAWSEMTAEKMVYQIGATGLLSDSARNSVRPASYIPD
ncbi:MAG: hypothetical protein J2P46_08840 [Zavarzinella sp.]|nr:hypothetical protein [Zavarzinella sp.]